VKSVKKRSRSSQAMYVILSGPGDVLDRGTSARSDTRLQATESSLYLKNLISLLQKSQVD
jgi:hypothetical protein